MKNISSELLQHLKSSFQDVICLLYIKAGNETLRLATRDLNAGEERFSGNIISLNTSAENTELPAGADDIFMLPAIQIKCLNKTGSDIAAEKISSVLAAENFAQIKCELYISVFPEDKNFQLSDALLAERYIIDNYRYDSSTITINLISEKLPALEQSVTRILEASFTPEADIASVGKFLPVIFGDMKRVPLFPIRTGRKTFLSIKLEPSDKIIHVDDTAGFPDAGSVQIDNEIIHYSSIDHNNLTLGVPEYPVIRDAPVYHKILSAVHFIPAGGFKYLAADHLCKSIDRIRANERILSPSEYEIKTESLGGRNVQTVTFPLMPVVSTLQYNDTLLTVDGTKFKGSWGIGLYDHSLYGPRGFDEYGSKTCARVSENYPVFEARFIGDLSNGYNQYGEMMSVRLCIETAASNIVSNATVFTLRFIKGNKNLSWNLRDGLLFSPVISKYNITNFVNENGGWGIFSGGVDSPAIRLAMYSAGEVGEAYIYNVYFEITYRGRLTSKIASNITADIQGMHDNGVLVENPADIIKAIISRTEFLSMPDCVDAQSFSSSESFLKECGYRFARRISSQISYREIFDEISKESMTSLFVESGNFKLLISGYQSMLSQSVFEFNEDNVLAVGISSQTTPLMSVKNQFVFNYNFRPPSPADRIITSEESSIVKTGLKITKVLTLKWHNAGSPGAANILAESIQRYYAGEKTFLTIDAAPESLILERGDAVSVRLPDLYPAMVPGKVVSVKPNFFRGGRFIIRVYPQETRFWQHSAETYIGLSADSMSVIFRIEGEIAAILSAGGNFYLKGEVIENDNSGDTIPAPVYYNSETRRMDFGYLAGDQYVRGFSITAGGNLIIDGGLMENHFINAGQQQDIIAAGEGSVSIAGKTSVVIAQYKAAEKQFLLAKTIYEFINNFNIL